MVPLSMTLSDLWPGFQGHDISWSQISEKRRVLKTKLLLHKRKLHLTYGMVLWLVTSTDLLNVSHGFVSISWASCWLHLQYWLLCEYCSFTIVIKDIVVINAGESDFHICLPISISLFICIILLCLHPVRAEALSDYVRLTSDDVCLSRTSGLSREQRELGRLKLAQR